MIIFENRDVKSIDLVTNNIQLLVYPLLIRYLLSLTTLFGI